LIAREDSARALPAYADDLARLVHLREVYEARGHGVVAGLDIPKPVVWTASILFTDLRGFTGLTERFANDPAGLLDVLNAHLKRVLRSIAICGGVVEKFVGDGVMATFGASDLQPDHVDRAMAAAIGLVGANEALNRRCAADWGFRLEVGVGVASGPVVIGAVGSPDSSELGVLGDAVNVAARLVMHAGPGEVLMTGTVYRAMAGMLQSELTTQSAVRGRAGRLEIYRMALLGGRSDLPGRSSSAAAFSAVSPAR
jgi:adenylate cyclase